MISEQEAKKKTKEALLNKLKNLNAKGQPVVNQHQAPSAMSAQQNQPPMRIDTQEDFRKMPYEGKAKYDNELKALNALKNETQERSQKPKKMFFEHYDTVEAYCPIIQNNSNPSGRPPNIPPEMYEGITVKPKRPWVYIGTENLPPVQYQQINQNSFKAIQKKNIQGKQQIKNRKPPAAGSKPRKKGNEKVQSQFGGDSQISNQIDIGQGESIFGSRYDNDSKYMMSSSKRGRISKNSQMSIADDESENTETRNKRLNIFQSMDNDDEYSSQKYDESEEEEKSKSKNAPKSKKDKIKKKKEESDEDSDE